MRTASLLFLCLVASCSDSGGPVDVDHDAFDHDAPISCDEADTPYDCAACRGSDGYACCSATGGDGICTTCIDGVLESFGTFDCHLWVIDAPLPDAPIDALPDAELP